MLFLRCQRVLTRTVLAALGLCALVSSVAAAKPSKPGRPGGFRLLSSALNIFQVNRVQCYVVSDGTICYTGSSTVPGGAWPRGTANSYIFGSGINVAGVIEAGDKAVNGFAGDTAGGFFNNTAGTNNGLPIRPIFDSNDPDDAAAWPDEARVPQGDATADLFDPNLQGGIAASQGDLWFLAWEGDPGSLASRTHPLGVLVETRAMGWNFPAGNEDILYFIYTFYNITSLDPNSYLGARPAMRPILLEQAQRFHALNTAKFGINLPQGGYAINDLFAAFTADMDVASATNNFAAVNVPFALGYTYDAPFSQQDAADIGWTFDPAIFGTAPFFPGPGFIGVKYLGSPTDPATGAPVGLTLFGTFSRSSGSIQDPSDDKQLYRYITGRFLPTDGSCSLPNPLESKICFVNISSGADMRFFQSSGPIDLPPGGFGSITVAYVFAAPVRSGDCPSPNCNVPPAPSNDALTILGDPARMANGVNTIDTMTGYLDNTNGAALDTNTSIVTQEEFVTVPGSLLNKALVAQAVFDNKFLLPFAPDRPEFFLVPGNNQVSVLWTRSPTETNGDPFFGVASSPTTPEGAVNPLYDPNFRDRDVEGYRVYRGRTDSPSELQLLAQFDYAPDADGRGIFTDFRALVNPVPGCAPELAITTTCGTTFSLPDPGQPFVGSVDVDLTGTITQLTVGNRVALLSGEAQVLPGKLDTAFADIARGRLGPGITTALANTGVPFIFVDRGVRNSLRYFYTVTAFDVNSLTSGPSSLESARLTKAVTPTAAASNTAVTSSFSKGILGRGVPLTNETVPTLDPATGKFSGPFPPANDAELEFVGEFAASLFSEGGEASVTLDGIGLGDSRNGVPSHYTFTSRSAADTVTFSMDIDAGIADGNTVVQSPPFPAALADPALASNFGAIGPTVISGLVSFGLPNYQKVTGQGRGCAEGGFVTPAEGTTNCNYNGPRWFAGDNETMDHPNGGSGADFGGGTGVVPASPFGNNNAGQLPGVVTIQSPKSYLNVDAGWRAMEASTASAGRAADYKVYWGNPGKIDSVMDVTHNVPVPFIRDSIGGGFGVLNVSGSSAAGSDDARPTVVTINDLSCMEPWLTGAAGAGARATFWGTAAPTCTAPFFFSDSAEQNPIAIYNGALTLGATAPVAANAGFLMWLAGDAFMFELEGGTLPTQTVWTMRQYTGFVSGGQGAAGDAGPYVFTEAERPFTAIGAELTLGFEVSNVVNVVEDRDLSRVHTVPDPYYVKSAYEASTEQKVLKFVGLPQKAIIRIYSASGVLVRLLEHDGSVYSATSRSQGSEMDWDLRNRNNQVVASGVYFYHVEAGSARRVGRFTVVNFAQ
jgi:hypothetical protein